MFYAQNLLLKIKHHEGKKLKLHVLMSSKVGVIYGLALLN